MMTEATNTPDRLVVATAATLQELEDEKRGAKAAVTAVNKKIKKARKDAAANGVQIKALDAVRDMLKDDPTELAQFMATLGSYLRAFKHPTGSQFDLFERDPGIPMDELWHAQGYTAGVQGENRDSNPHHRGDKGFDHWDQGYINGQKVLAAGMADIKAKPDAEPENEPANKDAADDGEGLTDEEQGEQGLVDGDDATEDGEIADDGEIETEEDALAGVEK